MDGEEGGVNRIRKRDIFEVAEVEEGGWKGEEKDEEEVEEVKEEEEGASVVLSLSQRLAN